MTRQTNLDLRAAFAAAIDEETTATQRVTPAPAARERINPIRPLAAVREAQAPGTPERSYITPGRKDLVRRMLEERYPAAEAARRYADIGPKWATMTPGQYQAGIDRLKGVAKLAVAPAAPVPPASRPAAIGPVAHQAGIKVNGELFEGKYTIVFGEGDDHVTIEVGRQRADAEFMPGLLVLSYLNGPDNCSDYAGFAHVTARGAVVIWKRFRDNERLAGAARVLVGDALAAAKAYSAMSGICPFCHNDLTHPDSLFSGWGERCAEKRGLPYGRQG
jgi:hypothetical protein